MTVILFVDEWNTVSRIDLVRAPNSVLGSWASLGEVVVVLGAPNRIGIGTDSIRSYYLAASMIFFHSRNSQGNVSPEDRFDGLSTFSRPLKTLPEQNLAVWHGFSSVQHYRDKWQIHPD
jgi:hypothetical protein